MKKETQESILLTPKQVSLMINISVGTLQDWRYKGVELNYIAVNSKTVLYKKSDVLEWIDSKYVRVDEEMKL